jgi:hypothetical protein
MPLVVHARRPSPLPLLQLFDNPLLKTISFPKLATITGGELNSGSINVGGSPIRDLSFPMLKSLGYFPSFEWLDSSLETVSFPLLETVAKTGVDLRWLPKLRSISLPALTTSPYGVEVRLRGIYVFV